jgi:PAS domain-containing protein
VRYEDVFDVIDRVYAAAITPEAWHPALEAIAQVFGAIGVNLMFELGAHRPDGVVVNYGVDPELVERYNAYYVSVDPLVEASLIQPVGSYVDTAFIPGWRSSELFCDLAAPFDIAQIAGSPLIRTSHSYAALSMMRRSGESYLDGQPLRAFHLIGAHIRRALGVQSRLSAAEQRHAELAAVTDQLSVGVVLVDASGSVVSANRAAQRMAADGDGIRLQRSGLAAERSDESTALRALVADAAATSNGSGFGTGGAMRITRPSGLRAYHVLVAPLGRPGPKRSASPITVDPVVVMQPCRDIGSSGAGSSLLAKPRGREVVRPVNPESDRRRRCDATFSLGGGDARAGRRRDGWGHRLAGATHRPWKRHAHVGGPVQPAGERCGVCATHDVCRAGSGAWRHWT